MSMVSGIVNFVKKCKNADSQSLWYRWLKFLIFLIALLVIIDILDHETYIYQSTALLDIVHPSTRQECRIKTLDNNKVFSNYRDVNANTIVETSKLPSQKKKLSIGIVYIYERNKSDSTWDENIMSGVLKNRQIYCARHGYSLINGHDSLDTSRPAAWSKLLAAKNALYMNQLDYIVYMDMDIVILDLDIKIEDFIDAANPTKITSDFIMATDWSGPNTGVWIAKNTQFTKNFLQLLWDQDQLVPPRSPEGASYPFEYEQRAFHYLLNTDVWQNRYWLKDYTGDYNMFRSHFSFMPQCVFNSYSVHPLYDIFGTLVPTAQYVEGDFLIHMAGKKGKKKSQLMEYYLKIADDLYTADEKKMEIK